MLVWSWLRGTSGWYTTTHPHILSCSIEDTVNLIFIGSTNRSSLKAQIQIEFWMDRKIIHVSLMHSVLYVSWEKNKQIKKMTFKFFCWNPTYHELLISVIHELLHPFPIVIISHMDFNKKLHRSWITSKHRSM